MFEQRLAECLQLFFGSERGGTEARRRGSEWCGGAAVVGPPTPPERRRQPLSAGVTRSPPAADPTGCRPHSAPTTGSRIRDKYSILAHLPAPYILLRCTWRSALLPCNLAYLVPSCHSPPSLAWLHATTGSCKAPSKALIGLEGLRRWCQANWFRPEVRHC